jgi:hypothetical protein
MLKYIIASLALTVGLHHPSIASESGVIKVEVVCTTIQTLDEVLTKYGEEAALMMVAIRESSGNIRANPVVFFMNSKTKTWTLVEQISEKEYCIIAMGEKVTPYFPDRKQM